MIELEPTIGIEIHVELNTKSKVFSDSENKYGLMPNTKTSVIDLGYPGTLPRLNKEVINKALKVAIILNCKINRLMHFDRKNYFYPDNTKNYQITQSKTPLGYDGHIDIEIDGSTKRIGISRVHIEEDTAKSVHTNNKTLLDFNRAGVPLIEIVTKPDIKSGREASLYIEKLRQLLLYADVSDVKMEEGSMRCDANVSLKEKGSDILGIKTEIKNIGSISSVEAGIIYEIKRQAELINNNQMIREETRRFDGKSGTTILMRVKETGNDYRYFPEPDIPPIEIGEEWISTIQSTIPKMPEERKKEYILLGVNEIVANKLVQNKELSDFFDSMLELSVNPINMANIITSDVVGYLNKNNKSLKDTKLELLNFKKLLDLLDKGEISSKILKDLLVDMLDKGTDVDTLINSKGVKQINNREELIPIIDSIILNNEASVVDYKNGKDRAIKYLMGEVMKQTKGQANPIMAQELLIEKLNKI
jgi:aspartyl-tRNA(Asn)/glutamyl-tRNA(Gln) amidotransferase subunit B